jgi:hypothetical protein
VPTVSLHTISDGLVGRLHQHPRGAAAAVARRASQPLATRMSMRFLETGLAVAAIAAALLIGLGR